MDAFCGVDSILAFFRGGEGPDSSEESRVMYLGLQRVGTGGSSTTGFNLLDLADDLTSLLGDSVDLVGFLVLDVVELFFLVSSKSVSLSGRFPLPPLEYLQRFLRREHTRHAIIAPFASMSTSHDSNPRLTHASHFVVYVS